MGVDSWEGMVRGFCGFVQGTNQLHVVVVVVGQGALATGRWASGPFKGGVAGRAGRVLGEGHALFELPGGVKVRPASDPWNCHYL